MKRLSKKQKVRLKLLNARYVDQRRGLCGKRRGNVSQRPQWCDRSIDAPVKFALDTPEDRNEVLDFIGKMLKNKQPNERLRLNFEYTQQILVDALLLFIANLQKAHKQHDKFSIIKIAPSKNEGINGVLTQTGVLDLCNQDFHINPEDNENVKQWRRLGGNVRDKYDPEKIYHFLLDAVGKSKVSNVLYSAVKEALSNIKHHAHKKNVSAGWWVFIHSTDDKHTVVVCDLGVGIPSSIKEGKKPKQQAIWKQLVTSVISPLQRPAKDWEVIQASMRIGESSTGADFRGKGLPKMKQVTEMVDSGGMLHIFSGKGCYAVTSGGREVLKLDYPDSINGTVVTWTIPRNVDELIEV